MTGSGLGTIVPRAVSSLYSGGQAPASLSGTQSSRRSGFFLEISGVTLLTLAGRIEELETRPALAPEECEREPRR